MGCKVNPGKRPDWLKVKVRSSDKNLEYMENLLDDMNLNTVCAEANCPNRHECYSNKTATFMILGAVCTRNCTFCDVLRGETETVDEGEIEKIAKASKAMGLEHIVVTSVTRDDLPDQGANHFAKTLRKLREYCPNSTTEVLIPDFQGDDEPLDIVLAEEPEILNHNIETVPRLYKRVRSQAGYFKSLELLQKVKQRKPHIYTKTGIMVGMGETEKEVKEVITDMKKYDVDIVTIGQYLRPSPKHYPVHEYIKPDLFKEYERFAAELGFQHIASGPLVRSSYNAAKVFEKSCAS